MITIKQKKIKKLEFFLETYAANFLGVIGKNLFIKIETVENDRFIVLQIPQSEYIKLLKEYFKEKKKFCDMYGHLCGTFGYHIAYEFEQIGTKKLWMTTQVSSDPYYLEVPLIVVTKWSKPDMEHG